MSITDQLDRLRAAVPFCTEVALADLSARLVLCVSADRRPPQEAMDALCDRAIELLDGPGAQAAGKALGSKVVGEAVDFAPGRCLVFLRSAVDPVEVLCCAGTPELDIDTLLPLARQALDEIAGEAP